MTESLETPKQYFKFPNIFKESGEFRRVATEFNIEESVLEYLAQQGQLVELTDDLWNQLENTDSATLEFGDWVSVENLANQVNRDWSTLRQKLEKGEIVEAPIIMKTQDQYHLVSGNTRLMVAKALGIRPSVLLFEIE